MNAVETFFPAGQPVYRETGTIWINEAVGRAYTRATRLDDLGLHVFTSASVAVATTLVARLDDEGDPMLWDNDACRLIVHDDVTAYDLLETLDAAHERVVAHLRAGQRLPAWDQMDGVP